MITQVFENVSQNNYLIMSLFLEMFEVEIFIVDRYFGDWGLQNPEPSRSEQFSNSSFLFFFLVSKSYAGHEPELIIRYTITVRGKNCELALFVLNFQNGCWKTG